MSILTPTAVPLRKDQCCPLEDAEPSRVKVPVCGASVSAPEAQALSPPLAGEETEVESEASEWWGWGRAWDGLLLTST